MRIKQTQNEVNEQLRADFLSIVENGVQEDTEYLSEAISFYELYTDIDGRNKAGIAPLQPYLDRVDEVQTLEDLNGLYRELVYANAPTPFRMGVMSDNVDPSKNVLMMINPINYLPDISFYEEGNAQGEAMLEERKYQIQSMAVAGGYSQDEAAQMAEDAISFDALIAQYMLTLPEQMQINLSTDNYIPFDEFCAQSESIDFEGLITTLAGETPDVVKMLNESYYQNIDSFVTQANLPMIKNWIKAGYLYENAEYLSEDIANACYAQPGEEAVSDDFDYRETTNGMAFLRVKEAFGAECSRYYSDKHLTDETKEEITKMCEDMIEEYKERFTANDWLEKETREKAIEKLDKMGIIVGHTGYENPANANLHIKTVEEGGTLLESCFLINENTWKHSFDILNKGNTGEDRAGSLLLLMKSFETNASYIGAINSIVINTAILNEPFYSASYSDSRNYGGIGAFIGHEISHAFDQQGSLYDANGDMVNWWTDKDAEEFAQRSQKMVDFFDGLPYMGGEVDGKLTVEENTADAGGLSVALEVLEESGEPVDYEEFFNTWSELWADESTEDSALLRLIQDVHAPGIYRVNQQMMLMDQFYETYGVQEGDDMFLTEDQRFHIW